MGKKVYQDVHVTLRVDTKYTNPALAINKYREAVAVYIDALEYVHNVTSGIVIAHHDNDMEEYDYWCDALPRYERELADAKQHMDVIAASMHAMTHPNV
jgi:hypothetical protein